MPSADPEAGLGTAAAIAVGRSRRCQCASVANSGVEVPSAINGSSDGNPPVASAEAGAEPHAAAGAGCRRGHAPPSAARPARIFAADISLGSCLRAMDRRLAREAVREDQRRRRIGIGQRLRDDDVVRHVGQRVVHHLRERRQQVAVVVGPELAARAQRRLDLRQHAAVREEPVERDVELVDLRREVGQHALHERPPHARIGIHRAGRRPDGVEDVRHRERVVDVARAGSPSSVSMRRSSAAISRLVKRSRNRVASLSASCRSWSNAVSTRSVASDVSWSGRRPWRRTPSTTRRSKRSHSVLSNFSSHSGASS